MQNETNNAMNYSTLTLDQVAAAFNSRVWNGTRVYLDQFGYKTKKAKATVYVYINADGELAISCYVDCPTQSHKWALGQKANIIDRVERNLADLVEELANEAAAEVAVAELVEEVNAGYEVSATNDDAALMLRKFKFSGVQKAALEVAAANGSVVLTADQMRELGHGGEGDGEFRCKFVFRGGRKIKRNIVLLPIEEIEPQGTNPNHMRPIDYALHAFARQGFKAHDLKVEHTTAQFTLTGDRRLTSDEIGEVMRDAFPENIYAFAANGNSTTVKILF